MKFETLLFDLQDGVATITLNRETAANSMNLQMVKDLFEVSLHCDADPAVRAVVITGAGKMFSAGGDLAAFSSASDAMPRLLKEITAYLHAAIAQFVRMRAPVVAAINGTAAGAGFSLACAADLAIASDTAKFTMAYTRVGLTPDGSASYFLPRLLGRKRALELMLTNRVLSAQEALEWGIVNQVVPATELSATASALAKQLAAGPTQSFGIVKDLVARSEQETLESQLENEARSIAAASRSRDAQEGIQAFLAKRAAKFSGN